MPSSGRRVGRAIGALLVAVAAALATSAGPAAGQGTANGGVLRTRIDDAITPVIADHVDDSIDRAEDGRYELLVVELDTPGGLDSSMRDIVTDILEAEVPVVVYVSPRGARAASAGALITLSAHVAAMAPGTAIGASTPVDLEGGEVGDKVVNDAAAYAEALAELRGRNVDVAAEMVTEGRSLPVGEAVDVGAVDLEAESLPELLDRIDGRQVAVGPDAEAWTLRTAGAAVDDHEMGWFRRIQQALANPNLVFLFLSLGMLALLYELAVPGVGAGGVVGATLILLGLFSLAVLPVRAVGVLLLLLAVAMFVAELFAPGLGVAAAGGTGALVLSAVFLFREDPGVEVSLAVVTPVALVVGGGAFVAGRLVVGSRRTPSTLTGPEALVGRVVAVRTTGPSGAQAFVAGAWWQVRATAGRLEEGAVVRVVGVDGLDLLVEPDQPQPDEADRSHEPDAGGSDDTQPEKRGRQDNE